MANHWFQRGAAAREDRPATLVQTRRRQRRGPQRCVADSAVVKEAFAAWKEEIAAAHERLDEDALDREVPLDDDTVSVRDVLVHVFEEYAGHADLLRECIDGRTGQ